jgi:hypothetical protein
MEDLLVALGQLQDELNNIIHALKQSTIVKDEISNPKEYTLAKAKILELTLKPVYYN